MKVVILAGGFGTRISEESIHRPKPMIPIGEMPILVHIMKYYAHFGHKEFIICAGYKQEYIKEYFAHYFMYNSDITFDFSKGKNDLVVEKTQVDDWKVTVVDTGMYTMTGGRIKRIQPYIGNEPFLMTYGDGVCDADINKLIEFHKAGGKIATLTAVLQEQQKGVLDIDEQGAVKSFREKAQMDRVPINAGFMVLEPAIFDYIEGDLTAFENEPMRRLTEQGQLDSYQHTGFWQCMDSLREKELLESLWRKGKAPWKVW